MPPGFAYVNPFRLVSFVRLTFNPDGLRLGPGGDRGYQPGVKSGQKTNDPLRSFASRLRSLRALKKLSQDALGAAIGVSQNAISTWERAESSPQVPELLALCALFEVTLDVMTGRSDFPHGLAPDAWLIDLDEVDRPVPEELWCVKIPRRWRVASYEEMRAIEKDVETRRAAKRRSK